MDASAKSQKQRAPTENVYLDTLKRNTGAKNARGLAMLMEERNIYGAKVITLAV